jgi:hypothetical protein
MEQHIAGCRDCAADLDQLRLTTAALRVLPDIEIPQRIVFLSSKIAAPSLFARFFGGFWNSAARLAFASACILGTALLVSAYRQPAVAPAEVSRQVNDAVAKAVAKVREEDADTITVLQDRLNTSTLLASAEPSGGAEGQ